MRPKQTAKPKPDTLRRVVPASDTHKKKEPKKLALKKTVTFDLMVALSSSEHVLSKKGVVSFSNADSDLASKQKSKSCIDIPATRVVSLPNHMGSITSVIGQPGIQNETNSKSSKSIVFKKLFTSLSDLCMLGPVLNLRKMPVKGILKKSKQPAQNDCDQSVVSFSSTTDCSCGPKATDSLLLVTNRSGGRRRCQQTQSRTWIQTSPTFKSLPGIGQMNVNGDVACDMCDILTASVQQLHISAQGLGDQAQGSITFVVPPGCIRHGHFPQCGLPMGGSHVRTSSVGTGITAKRRRGGDVNRKEMVFNSKLETVTEE